MPNLWFEMSPMKHYEIVFSDGNSFKFKCTGGQLDESNGKPIDLHAKLQGIDIAQSEVYEIDKTETVRIARVA